MNLRPLIGRPTRMNDVHGLALGHRSVEAVSRPLPVHSRVMVMLLGLLLCCAVELLGDAREDGMGLAEELRSSMPPEPIDVQGLIRMRAADGRRTTLPFTYRVAWITNGWVSVYEARNSSRGGTTRLTVVHRPGRRNEYRLRDITVGGVDAVTTVLHGEQAMVPFAGSDFWLADLGMEYLHWSDHRIVENLRIKMRKGRPCRVLESVNPHSSGLGYTRVLSWVDRETGKPILAEAYSADGRLVKEFEVGGVTKVNGVWELKNLEMRDLLKDSRTVLEFTYHQQE